MSSAVLTSWWFFGLLVLVVAVAGMLWLRKLARWRPTDGSGSEAKQAEARLFAVRSGGERR